MRIVLYTQFYTPKNEHRRAEIDTCLRMNVRNPGVDEVHILLESPPDGERVPASNRVRLFHHAPRMTYGEWLRRANQLAPGDVAVLVNADIFLDETIGLLKTRPDEWAQGNPFLALTRYNPKDGAYVLNDMAHWTQDTWIVRRGDTPFPKGLIQEADFELGYPGCDNKIAYVMHSYGYGVSNPCLQIRSIHLQADEGRSYDSRNDKLIGLHAFVHPVGRLGELSHLDFELLTRSAEDPLEFKVNHWINHRKEYFLKGGSPNQVNQPGLRSKVQPDVLGAAQFSGAAAVVQALGHASPPPAGEHADRQGSFGDGIAPPLWLQPRLSFIKHSAVPRHGLQTRVQFTNRFQLCEDAHTLYWIDAAGSGAAVLRKQDLPKPLSQLTELDLFILGFAPPAFDLFPTRVRDNPRTTEDALFWQYPARTEQDAWQRVSSAREFPLESGHHSIYIGLPWATFIDREMFPEAALVTAAAKIKWVARYLAERGVKLRVNTVCQHILWERHVQRFKQLGITDLWISHKEKGIDELYGVRLHAWSLYAVNHRELDRREGITNKPAAQRQHRASFLGAYMGHYLSDVRLKLAELNGEPGFEIKLTNDWHFNQAVYRYQVQGKATPKGVTDDAAVREYNQKLCDSVFSLCPVGAGPNTLRVWESLALGAVPVVLSDRYELPDIRELAPGSEMKWTDGMLVVPESEWRQLPQLLGSFDLSTLARMQGAALQLYALSETFLPLARNAVAPRQKPVIRVPYYGPEDKYFYRSSKMGFYDLVQDWAQRGYCTVQESNDPFFWWGEEGGVLLFDRDRVTDLLDRKLCAPRWPGRRPYRYGFFANQYNLPSARNFKMPYWGSKPALLEQYALKHPVLPYSKRDINSIFLGSIENETQEFYRERFKAWPEHISEYYCADKLNKKEPHKYGFVEYLARIGRARFGVSFVGNGPKCMREIEYMALGTPLIITSGVEVDYPEPLLEGVHYLVARQPADIPRIVREVDDQKWHAMSDACRNWYLRNATATSYFNYLFRTLERLEPQPKLLHTWASEDAAHPLDSLTAASVAIFEPGLRRVNAPAEADVVVQSGHVVTGEFEPGPHNTGTLPSVAVASCHEVLRWFARSSIPQQRELAVLVGYRAVNFTVRESHGLSLNPYGGMFHDGLLRLETSEARAAVETDYNFCRALKHKYPLIAHEVKGPGVFPQVNVREATLYGRHQGTEQSFDFRDRLSEYCAVYGELPPADNFHRIFKLWEYDPLEFSHMRARVLIGGSPGEVQYKCVDPWRWVLTTERA